MDAKAFLDILARAEKLKCTTRHADTTSGRRESVAEHCWRLALMALLLAGEEEFRDYDMSRVIRMCLIHDLGEAFTGDIPAFEKNEAQEQREQALFDAWVEGFPPPQRAEFRALLAEMDARESREVRLYKALDKIEAVIQHNEASIDSWLPLEYELQKRHGAAEMQFSPWLRALKAEVDAWTERKIKTEGGKP